MQIHAIPYQTSAVQASLSMHEFKEEGKERGNQVVGGRGLDG